MNAAAASKGLSSYLLGSLTEGFKTKYHSALTLLPCQCSSVHWVVKCRSELIHCIGAMDFYHPGEIFVTRIHIL